MAPFRPPVWHHTVEHTLNVIEEYMDNIYNMMFDIRTKVNNTLDTERKRLQLNHGSAIYNTSRTTNLLDRFTIDLATPLHQLQKVSDNVEKLVEKANFNFS